MADLDIGKKAFQYFYEASKSYSAFKFKSFAEFYAVYGKNADIYADGIGGAIRANDMSDSKIKASMTTLAKQTQGRVPADHQPYIRALGSTAGQINYLDLTVTVAKDVGSKVADGAVAFGDSAITSLKWFTNLMPFLLIGGVIWYIYSFGKNNSTVSSETRRDIKNAYSKAKAAVKARMKKADA